MPDAGRLSTTKLRTPRLYNSSIYLCPSFFSVFKAKKSVSSGKHRLRLSINNQLIFAAVIPFLSAPITCAISSIVYITLTFNCQLSTINFQLSSYVGSVATLSLPSPPHLSFCYRSKCPRIAARYTPRPVPTDVSYPPHKSGSRAIHPS